MLKRVLNLPERITYDRLIEVCTRRSAVVHAKVRLADILPIEGAGLPGELFKFALQSHYDFVITDSNQEPLFAVEFDGPQHGLSVQVERDAKKDELSRRFKFPLVRVRASDLCRTEWRLDRLTEWTERWFERINAKPGNGPVSTNLLARNLKVQGRKMAMKPSCPLCQSDMVIKNSRYGLFFSCVHYPDCKGACDFPPPSVQTSTQARANFGVASTFSRREVLIAGVAVGFLALTLVIVSLIWSRPAEPRRFEPPEVVTRPDTSIVPRPNASIIVSDASTSKQMNLLGLLIRRRKWDASERDAQMESVLGYRRRYEELSKKEASKLITAWDDRGK